ncbi:MAG: bifunctional tRNA (5-methylaminomethyl-2-thiouridine)(34)-methyltransferase MnmD/FAD-dependent 5-carboxymethylaminomethyl-2-thiouridine(34) oxidoreductase MnmC [Lentisphaeria bacterium]|nr:bifunctional tRNA (5-methylaminomethyl-2-thiouridine)(34)-methyltransferase MnmD/FAD-dependent 5-carboxymethylaminomethyl-2-thiouridine(34) oxidoreductase MnmC [Lentisphaeria bacterium]
MIIRTTNYWIMPGIDQSSESNDLNLSWSENGTLISDGFDDVFYNQNNGLEETRYVFMQGNHITERLQQPGELVIGETGFGTGLNFLATWLAFKQNATPTTTLTFVSCEKFLLDVETIKKAHQQFPEVADVSQQLCEQFPVLKRGTQIIDFEGGRIRLVLLLGDATDVWHDYDGRVDAWYLDGFAPSKNPSMWNAKLYREMARHSHNNTTLATFTAVGDVRRGLAEEGFAIERVKGYAHKKHMTVGKYERALYQNVGSAPWFRIPKSQPSVKNIAIIGAGLAGTSLAYELQNLGASIHIFDKGPAPASGASGNPTGMILPVLAKQEDPLASLGEIALPLIRQELKDLDITFENLVEDRAYSPNKAQKLQAAIERLPDAWLHEAVTPEYDLELLAQAHFPLGLSTSPKQLCENLLKASQVTTHYETAIHSITKVDKNWHITDPQGKTYSFSHVIIANAFDAKQFEQCDFIPFRPARGQLVVIPEKFVKKSIPHTINYGHYVIPQKDGSLLVGATFDVDDNQHDLRHSDSIMLLEKFIKHFPTCLSDSVEKILPHLLTRVAVRCLTPDHFPVIGPIPDFAFHRKEYSELHFGKAASHYPGAQYQDGLYICSGFGSRGILFSSIAAKIIHSQITGRNPILPANLAKHILPNRFLIKKYQKTPR